MAEKGFDLNLGARPLKRVIQREVLDPLSLKIVSGELKQKERVIVDVDNGKIVLKLAKDFLKTDIKNQREKVFAK